MDLTLFSLSGLLIAASSGFMALVMFVSERSRLHVLWGVFCISVFVWGIGGFFIGAAKDVAVADHWWRLTHIGVAFIPVLFLHFVLVFLKQKRPATLFVFYAIAAVFAVFSNASDLLITNMRFVFNEFYYDSPPGVLYPFLTVYFFGLTIYSHAILWQALRHSTNLDETDRARIRYFFLGMLISFSGGSLSFLPVYGIDVYPVLNFAVIAYPVIIGYAILRHQLFDIKVVTTEIVTFGAWIFLLIRIFFSRTLEDRFIDGGLLAVMIIFGIILIRSVLSEVRQRERLEKLTKELETANVRLLELDQMKTDFISIASHQLRTPLTAIKGYSSMVLEESYGAVPLKIRGILEKILESSQRLIFIVNDLLDISRIEQGKLSLTLEEVKVVNILKDVIDELKINADGKGITLEFSVSPDDADLIVKADLSKIRQAFVNLVDNSIKYTPSGFVSVSLERNNKEAVISVKDSGIGMSEDTLSRLFQKFIRGRDAVKYRTDGSGVGLYIVKEIVNAHGGKAWATSEGTGKGSQFYISLPLFDPKAEAIQKFAEGM